MDFAQPAGACSSQPCLLPGPRLAQDEANNCVANFKDCSQQGKRPSESLITKMGTF
jgi:hypothetical protein